MNSVLNLDTGSQSPEENGNPLDAISALIDDQRYDGGPCPG
ncbi:MAG: hypothetical protein R3B47_05660 [Bacteroidia bacterium]